MNKFLNILIFFILDIMSSESFAQTVSIIPKFDYAESFSEGLAAVTLNGNNRFIDRTGKVVINAKNYDSISSFSDGLARVLKGKYYGYIDKAGKLVIDTKFENAQHFHNGLAVVAYNFQMFGSNSGVIDKNGKFIINPYVRVIFDYKEGFAAANFGELGDPTVGVFDLSGNVIIPPQFKYINEFSEGLAAVLTRDGGWGFINQQGDWHIKPRFEALGNFYNDRALFGSCEGKIHNPYSYSFPSCKFGYMNRGGEIVVPPQFKFASNFSEDRAIVSFNLNSSEVQLIFTPNPKVTFGYIDYDGKLVVDPVYIEARPFVNGVAAVCKTIGKKVKRWGYIDKNGNALTEFIYESAGDVSEGMAAVKFPNGKWGYLSF